VLADPTARTVPFGEVPPQVREATLMPIEPGGGELFVATPSAPADHVETTRLALTLDARGDAHGTVELDVSGIPAALLRHRLLEAMPRRRAATVTSWLDLEQAQVTGVARLDGMKLEPKLSLAGGVDVPRVVLRAEGASLLRLSSFVPRWLPLIPQGPRFAPVVLALFHSTRSATLKLELPSGLEARALPPPVLEQNRWFEYRLSFKREARALVAERQLVVKNRIVPAADLDELRQALARVHRAESAPVLLEVREK
jgi:hypothetical protein